MNYKSINFRQKFELFNEQWQPKVIAEMNEYQFKVVKLQGDFLWHDHKDTDETFIVCWKAICESIFGMAQSMCRPERCSWFQRASSTSLTPNRRSSYS